MSGCELCGTKADLKCSRCLATCCCCERHQREDWPRHKKICKKAADFPASVLERQVQPPEGKPCFFVIRGSVRDGWGHEMEANERFPIAAEQPVQFTELPSHACTFVDGLTRPDTVFMMNLSNQAHAQGFKCYRWADNASCDQPVAGILLHAGCMIVVPPKSSTSNEFHARIGQNGCVCTRRQCFKITRRNLETNAEAAKALILSRTVRK